MATEQDKHDEGKEPKKGFKIVDRRRFNEDGTTREGADVAPEPAPAAKAEEVTRPGADRPQPPAAKAEAPKAEAAKPEQKPDQKKPSLEEAPGGLSFSIFLQSLAQQALMQMGLIPWPHGQRELHLEQARDTIDILQLLKVKTKGNLSAEEQQLMDTVLYELKMSWVEVQQAIARSKAGAMPRPPGR
jgi:hypothetical protein